VLPAVRFESVSKKFTLHKERPQSFQEVAVSLLRRKKNNTEEFWALQDVSFVVERGQTVGLIGPNGAGKSTVLKLVTRIIEPSAGKVVVNGKVGALLELGTGFHPDLTGRENIYLQGSLMGLSRAQIQNQADDIIAFAELERFIDVPVKHYSSGMYVRLGFSVAVHISPDILLLDEVLTVGDAAFQRKCLERIDRLRSEGVTILFVSHSAEAVKSVCSHALWLEDGRLVANDGAEAVVSRYMASSWANEEGRLRVADLDAARWGNRTIEIVGIRLLGEERQEKQLFRVGEVLTIEISYRAAKRIERPVFGLGIHRSDGIHIAGPNTRLCGYEISSVCGEGVVQCTVPYLPLLEGLYYVSVAAHDWEDNEMYDYHDRLYPFRVLPSEGEKYGIVSLQGIWSWTETPDICREKP